VAIAVSIFLSAFFLGCVFLYIKSESKEKWRKYLLFLIGIPVVFVSIFLYLIIDELREKVFYKTEPQKDTLKLPIHLNGVKLGETLWNLQFEHGAFRKSQTNSAIFFDELDLEDEKNWNYQKYFSDEKRITILTKGQTAEIISYNCPSTNPLEDPTYHHLIRCGDDTAAVFRAYGKKEVSIFCSDEDVEWRLYEIKNRNIRFYLRRDKVRGIVFSDQPFSSPKRFRNKC